MTIQVNINMTIQIYNCCVVFLSCFILQRANEWKYQETVDKAIANIVSNVDDIDNSYAQAIAAYALHLADHPKKDDILNKLIAKSIVKGTFQLTQFILD